MQHKDAIRNSAVERYLLDQMVEEERAIFEEHYVDCRVCAADITEGMRLLVVGKVVARENPVTTNVVPFRDWFGRIPATIAASLLFSFLGTGVGYRIAQQQHDPATELVRVVPPATELLGVVVRIDTGVSRAGIPPEVPPVRTDDVLTFDVQPHDDAASYDAVIVCGGKIQSRLGISREKAADAITLRLGDLPAGRCALVIEGVQKDGKSFEITKSPFEVGERAGVR